MGVIEIIGTGWRLYCSCFYRYVAIALRGMAWVFAPTLLLTLCLLWMLKQRLGLGDFSGPTALFVPAWLVLFGWCKAQSLGHLAGISRLTYQSLRLDRRADEAAPESVTEETVADSLRFTRSRRFSFLGSVLVQRIIFSLVTVAFVLSFSFAVGLTFAGIGMVPGAEPSVTLFFLGGGGMLVSAVLLVGISVWLVLRMLLAEQALAVEKALGAIASIGRSWQLTRQNTLHTTCVAALVFFISLPVGFFSWLVAQAISYAALKRVGVVVDRADISSVDFLPLIVSYLILMLVGMIGGIVTQPFFRSVFTTLYFDARNRKESAKP